MRFEHRKDRSGIYHFHSALHSIVEVLRFRLIGSSDKSIRHVKLTLKDFVFI